MTQNARNGQIRHIYLVPHGAATSKEANPDRPLTHKGREEVEAIAAWAACAGLRVDQIRHSGKRRAQETAEILADKLNVKSRVSAVAGLSPNDDVNPVAEELETEQKTVMLVGHLPFLSRLASRLILNRPQQTVVQFQNGGIVGLVNKEGIWMVDLLVAPAIIPS